MDPIDSAVARVAEQAEQAAQAEARKVVIQTLTGTFLESDRPFSVSVPRDITPTELGALVELLMNMRLQVDAAERSPIVRASAMPAIART